MDACRREIGTKAAEIIAARVNDVEKEGQVTLAPTISFGDTLRGV